jgi:DNA-binding NarL/FixJ family response regulator
MEQADIIQPPMALFIAEDSGAVRERLVRSLDGLAGVSLAGVASAVPESIAGLRDRLPEALVLDLQLEDGSGLDVLRAVRSELPHLRVIVLTNFATEPYRRAALAEGAEVFLDKSAEFGRVREILATWQRQAAPARLH